MLRKVWRTEITGPLLQAEVQRIATTTRAPETLAEIQHALGDDPERFAHSFARPILVERLLREKLDNDDTLHAPQRRAADRDAQRTARREAERRQCCKGAGAAEAQPCRRRDRNHLATRRAPRRKARHRNRRRDRNQEFFGPDAQLLSSPQAADGKERKFYFADLPGELQNVLRVQLRQAGDVSAVIEMPGGFLLYVAREKTDAVLSVAPACPCPSATSEQWLEEQAKEENENPGLKHRTMNIQH